MANHKTRKQGSGYVEIVRNGGPKIKKARKVRKPKVKDINVQAEIDNLQPEIDNLESELQEMIKRPNISAEDLMAKRWFLKMKKMQRPSIHLKY